jgi:mannosyltransferase
MSADEGAAWATAAQPLGRLLELQPRADAGKLPLYHLLLHYWIGFFGDNLGVMRSLSAALDTISVVVFFAVVRELYAAFAEGDLGTGELGGGFAAVMFATNVAMVKSARTARMYSLMTAAELIQIFFFVRSQRRGGFLNYLPAAIFLALAIAANFTAAFMAAGEILWLAYLFAARSRGWQGAGLRMAGPALSLLGGFTLLLPFLRAATISSQTALEHGALSWIAYQPPLQWSYEALRYNTGTRSLFRLFLALSAFAFWRHSAKAPLPSMFMALMVIAPFAAVTALAAAGRPMMVYRYVLVAQIAFLGLAATGAAAFESNLGRTALFLLIIWLSVYSLKHASPAWVDWRRAAAEASARPYADAEIAVVPAYAVNAVRYYLPVRRRALAVGLDSGCGTSQLLILSQMEQILPAYSSQLEDCYPRILGRASFVQVRSR